MVLIRGYLALIGVVLAPVAQSRAATDGHSGRHRPRPAKRGDWRRSSDRDEPRHASGANKRQPAAEASTAFPRCFLVTTPRRAEAPGFQRLEILALVEAGTTTRADLVFGLQAVSEVITVGGALPQMRYDSPAVSGLITHDQIRALPLNGRGLLEPLKLEPGLLLPSPTNRNRSVVSVLAAPAQNVGGARFTIDGGSVTSVGLGGAQMRSPGVDREFQLSSVNFDLSAGITHAGAVNVVTRGGDRTSATAFLLLSRSPPVRVSRARSRPGESRSLVPAPAVRRRGRRAGPPRPAFYFGSWERNDQQTVGATKLNTPEFATEPHYPEPLGESSFARADGRINGSHSVFIRHSHDGNRAFCRVGQRVPVELEYDRHARGPDGRRADQRRASHTRQRSPGLVLRCPGPVDRRRRGRLSGMSRHRRTVDQHPERGTGHRQFVGD